MRQTMLDVRDHHVGEPAERLAIVGAQTAWRIVWRQREGLLEVLERGEERPPRPRVGNLPGHLSCAFDDQTWLEPLRHETRVFSSAIIVRTLAASG